MVSVTTKILLFLALVIVAFGAVYIFVVDGEPKVSDNNTVSDQQTHASQPKETFDKDQYSLTEPSSIWVLINKQNAIPTSYVPEVAVPKVPLWTSPTAQHMQVSTKAQKSLEKLFAAAKNEGINLVLASGYRSAALQSQLYNSYVAQDGQAKADTYSARPGHSEHQTGLAADVATVGGGCYLETCWGDTREGTWVAKNAHKYGFIVRYPKNKKAITGYQYEPWHLRFVGDSLATEIKQSGKTMEEYFGWPPAPTY